MEQGACPGLQPVHEPGRSVIEFTGDQSVYLVLEPDAFEERNFLFHEAIRMQGDGCIPGVCQGVDEQVVVSALQGKLVGKSFVAVVHVFPVCQILSDTHVGMSVQRRSQVTHGLEQVIGLDTFAEKSFPAGISAISQYDVRSFLKVYGQVFQPLVTNGFAGRFRYDNPVVPAGLDSHGDTQLLAAYIPGGLRNEGVVQVRIIVLQQFQDFLIFAGGLVVDHNHFVSRVILGQDGRKVLFQKLAGVLGDDDDREGRTVVGNRFGLRLHA